MIGICSTSLFCRAAQTHPESECSWTPAPPDKRESHKRYVGESRAHIRGARAHDDIIVIVAITMMTSSLLWQHQ